MLNREMEEGAVKTKMGVIVQMPYIPGRRQACREMDSATNDS